MKKMRDIIKKILRSKKGAVIVLFAAGMTMMMGVGALVMDLGVLYVNKAQLEKAVDAAVLAGVQELPGSLSRAVQQAQSYAAQNGKTGDQVAVDVINSSTKIRASGSRQVSLFFAALWGQSASTVHAQSAASIAAISGASGCVPWGIEKMTLTYGVTYTLKEGGGSGYTGNYGGLALGGNGASVYRENIKYGYQGKLSIGQWVSTEPGNMSGPTSDGVNYRIGLDPNATFSTVQKGSARIVVVPIMESMSVNGRKDVQIAGFAAFFLEGVGGSGNNNYVTGKFMQMVMPGDIGAGTSYGLYGAKLTAY